MTEASDLFACDWQELRSEVAIWEATGENLHGYDGYTRYWCKHAVLGVYWVAEQQGSNEIEYELTSDIDLVEFGDKFAFTVSDDIKLRLAEHVGWHGSAANMAWLADDLNPQGVVGDASHASSDLGQRDIDLTVRGFMTLMHEFKAEIEEQGALE